MLIVYLVGVLVGVVMTLLLLALRSALGFYRVDPVDPDEGTYSIKIRLTRDDKLLKKKLIMLYRESQK